MLRKRRLRGAMIPAAIATAALAFPMTAQAGHWCRNGDPPIYASAHTTCPFAGGMVSEYFSFYGPSRGGTMYVRSPVTRKTYRLTFSRSGVRVTVRGRHGIGARFDFYN